MKPDPRVIERFHRTLVEEIRRDAPDRLDHPFTVAEIYQSLVPYRTHRDRIGVDMNDDYEDALLRLLAGEGDFLVMESESARDRIRRELQGRNPNTGLYREFAAVEVRLNPRKLPGEADGGGAAEEPAAGASEGSRGAAAGREGRTGGGTPGSVTDADPAKAAPEELPSSCPDCGGNLPARETLRYCPFCGASPFVVSCESCGETLNRSWRFCVSCGTPSEG
jgi:hypothetical protein